MKQQLITTLLALCITFPLNIFPQSNLPSKKERIYSLSMIWKELEYNFAFPSYFQKHRLDSLYLNYLPKIENVKDEYEYYRILSSFMANMNEAHTRIIPPQKLPYDMRKVRIREDREEGSSEDRRSLHPRLRRERMPSRHPFRHLFISV